jgi:hypothetical protein
VLAKGLAVADDHREPTRHRLLDAERKPLAVGEENQHVRRSIRVQHPVGVKPTKRLRDALGSRRELPRPGNGEDIGARCPTRSHEEGVEPLFCNQPAREENARLIIPTERAAQPRPFVRVGRAKPSEVDTVRDSAHVGARVEPAHDTLDLPVERDGDISASN